MYRTQKLLARMDELSRWLRIQNEEHLEQEHAVHSQTELEQLDDAIKVRRRKGRSMGHILVIRVKTRSVFSGKVKYLGRIQVFNF